MNHLRYLLTKNRNRIILLAILIAMVGVLFWQEPARPLQVAVAKGGRMLEMSDVLDSAANQSALRELALSEEGVKNALGEQGYGFLYAYRLGTVESRAWHDRGCTEDACAQVTFYDFESGGTLEVVVNSDDNKIIDFWRNPDARPGASPYIIPRAMAVLAADNVVRSLLGDVRSAEPMMVPMSTWMLAGECQEDWCVDLTFMSPDGSGEILHTLVNMEKEKVSRVYYTRGRPDRIYKRPAAQQANFNNGCHEQLGWNVCWEMTAHDGINFYDATFDGKPIFSSAKISQVEVYYPSWPGGYRDEIGYSSSVPPYFGTHIREFDGGFEVSQLYTEFLRWPNCICCYRYEQIIRFYADGTFEPDFISHGPGCDDISEYRPFWRIDLDFGGQPVTEVQVWDEGHWTEAETEFSVPLFEGQSPGDGLVYFATSEENTIWKPLETDPIGEDDGRLIVLRENEGEGDGPVAAGPADTFWPPARWLNDESLVDQELVVWYIPILHTKKGEPWWCMPDPEPDFSPCNALSRVEPAGDLILPQAPEFEATTSVEATAEVEPTSTITAAPTRTPVHVSGTDAISIIQGSGCGSCHVIGVLGQPGKVGPDLSNIGNTAGRRIPGVSAEQYIRQSILDPGAFIAPECPDGPCLDGIMPRMYAQSLSPEQQETLVDFLLEQKIDLEIQDRLTAEGVPSSIGEATSRPDGAAGTTDEESAGVDQSTTITVVVALTLFLVILLAGLYFGIKWGTPSE